jgi:hypothetical protein
VRYLAATSGPAAHTADARAIAGPSDGGWRRPIHDFIAKTHEVIALTYDFIKKLDEVMFWPWRRGGCGRRGQHAFGFGERIPGARGFGATRLNRVQTTKITKKRSLVPPPDHAFS